MDTRVYKVEFSDGTMDEFHANVIAENLFSQVDSKGRQYILMKEISDHKKDGTAISKSDGWIIMPNGRIFERR
jgi:hypothetical protein